MNTTMSNTTIMMNNTTITTVHTDPMSGDVITDLSEYAYWSTHYVVQGVDSVGDVYWYKTNSVCEEGDIRECVYYERRGDSDWVCQGYVTLDELRMM